MFLADVRHQTLVAAVDGEDRTLLVGDPGGAAAVAAAIGGGGTIAAALPRP